MKVFRSRPFTACIASMVTAIVVGGIAWAQIPGPLGVITGCYNNKTGALRVIDPSKTKCVAGTQTQIKWNQQGLAGTPGAPGTPGANGSPGPQGPPGPGATCSGYPHTAIDWSGCNLAGAILMGQELNQANLSHTDLTGAYLGPSPFGCQKPPPQTQNSVCSESFFNGTNFTGANLTSADLHFSEFDGVNFTGATGMGSANLTDTFWSNTICPDLTNSDSHGNTCVGHL